VQYPGLEQVAIICYSEQQNHDPAYPSLRPSDFDCDTSMRGLTSPVFFMIILPFGVGAWLIVFGLKEISLIAFKKVPS
ncbi:MAG: hypothetical protein ACREAY_06890, partial [Nitrososphaera sp.]|uniref:hypothetical protein n=1 Tax=Nitrososphaera sp. TaxID=1971748 RepID=UPI003D6E9FA8